MDMRVISSKSMLPENEASYEPTVKLLTDNLKLYAAEQKRLTKEAKGGKEAA